MSRSDLPVLVLQNVTHRSLKHSGTPAAAVLKRAACWPSSLPEPPASTPIILIDESERNG